LHSTNPKDIELDIEEARKILHAYSKSWYNTTDLG
jgi:hypothetical protein